MQEKNKNIAYISALSPNVEVVLPNPMLALNPALFCACNTLAAWEIAVGERKMLSADPDLAALSRIPT